MIFTRWPSAAEISGKNNRSGGEIRRGGCFCLCSDRPDPLSPLGCIRISRTNRRKLDAPQDEEDRSPQISAGAPSETAAQRQKQAIEEQRPCAKTPPCAAVLPAYPAAAAHSRENRRPAKRKAKRPYRMKKSSVSGKIGVSLDDARRRDDITPAVSVASTVVGSFTGSDAFFTSRNNPYFK